ncbi:hypothetical protein [Mesorhizobium sp. M8A.F.Ca.ET.021.01.1.1]|uniref:hypothetical protein n=1 Tax=Mesorhizobium sp. M8A.F.Ca.ET.021.01.1.1 TaxID=2496757 RepID=UPI000FCAC353|nr:hypothetical protein [Mesorhizobium sp. M8A.F.Ca.ET.021.01.1.1]RUW57156.1 hypothetical protein EOA36_00805 [Mesorhizobium sp. M8A.F.Ca.ET.021.01.1.1]
MSETPFLQSWLGGAFSHVKGDIDFLNADGSAVVTTGDYQEIVQFVEEQDEVFADLLVDQTLAGFALQFPSQDIEPNAGVFAPSFAVYGNGYRWDVYLVEGDTDRVRKIVADLQPIENDGHTVERVIPLPVKSFEMTDADADRVERGYRIFTTDEIEAAFFAPGEQISDEPTSRVYDAEIWGTMTPEVAALPIALSVAENRFEKEWKSVPEAPFKAVFEGMFAQHKIGKKEGRCFVTGTLGQSKRRTKNNVLKNYMMGIDVDSGASLEDCFQRVRAAGLTCILYTTHSHGSTGIEVAQDRFHRWAEKSQIDTTPTTESIRRYLREETPYVDDVVDAAAFIEKRQDDGMKLIIQTRPIDKFRMLFPLAAPFIYTEQDGAHKDVINLWSQKVLGLGRSFGIDPDPAARDPSRLFYLPRHSKDHHNYRVMLTCGRLIKFEDIPSAGTAKVSSDPFDQAAYIMGATARGQIVSPTLGVELRQWARDRSHGFDIAQVFKDHCEDKIRTEQSETKFTIECPFDDDHSNPGDPDDQGCFIQSAGADAETFSFHCSHAGCSGRDRLAHMQKAMQDGWFPDSILTDPTYDLAGIDDEEKPKSEADDDIDGEDAKQADYSTRFSEAVEAVSAISKTSSRAKVQELYHQIAALGKRSDRNEFATKIAKTLDLVKADVMGAINGLRSSGQVDIDDDTPDPATLVKQLRRTYKKFKADKNVIIVPVVDSNMKGSIDYFVDACNVLNGREPWAYSYGSQKIRCVQSTNNEYLTETLTRPVIKSVAQIKMEVIKFSSDGSLMHDKLPDELADQACVSPALALHKLEGFSELPYFTKDGKLVTTAGYDRDGCRILRYETTEGTNPYAPDQLFEVNNANLALAKKELFGLFSDFPFKDHPNDEDGGVSSKAHLLAMMLQPLVRSMFEGNTPFYMVDKPAAGTGATLLVTTAMRIATGTTIGTVAMSNNEEEQRKSITARFQTGTNVTFFDNLTQPINSPHLANLATSSEWEDRLLGSTAMVKIPNRMQVILAGNNVRTSDENTRRVLPIRLDLDDDPTDSGRVFAIADLKGHVEANSERLYKHLILLVQYWLQNRPAGYKASDWHGFSLPSFEQYCGVIGSLLETIGVEGFGAACKYVKSDSSSAEAWGSFLAALANSPKGRVGADIKVHYDFVESKPMKMADIAAFYADWGDKEHLPVNGTRGVPINDDPTVVQKDMTNAFGAVRGKVFRFDWKGSSGEFERIKVKIVSEKTNNVTTWFIRRIESDRVAA